MRRFITIGITKTGTVDILHGAEKGYSIHRDEFAKLEAGKKKGKASPYAEVQVIDISKGVRKRRRFGSIKLKGVDESGKRTVARTVKPKKAKKAVKKARKAAANRTMPPRKKPAVPAKPDAPPPSQTSGAAS